MKMCIPYEEREPNEVDRLREKIQEIQAACNHRFRFVEEPLLYESLVEGVFAGDLRGRAKVNSSRHLVLVCTECSKTRTSSVQQLCPLCLSKMEETEFLGAGSRERYFGLPYLYYSVVIHECSECEFVVASDRWDP